MNDGIYRVTMRATPQTERVLWDHYAGLSEAAGAADFLRRCQCAVETEIWNGETLISRWESYPWKHRHELPVYRVMMRASSSSDRVVWKHCTELQEAADAAAPLLWNKKAAESEIWKWSGKQASPELVCVYRLHQPQDGRLIIQQRKKDRAGEIQTTWLTAPRSASYPPARPRTRRRTEGTVSR